MNNQLRQRDLYDLFHYKEKKKQQTDQTQELKYEDKQFNSINVPKFIQMDK